MMTVTIVSSCSDKPTFMPTNLANSSVSRVFLSKLNVNQCRVVKFMADEALTPSKS